MKDLEQAKVLIGKAKTRIVLDHPFFASILLRRPMTFTTMIPTMAVDAKARIYINPEFVVSLSVTEVIFGLAHECLHVMFQHAGRQGERQKQRWNVAGDAVINDGLIATCVGTFIPGCVNMPGSKDKTAETVYDELPDSPEGPGGMGDDLIPGDGSDDPTSPKPMSEAEYQEVAGQIKVEIAQAAQAARMQGAMPGALERFVEEILNVKTPWQDILRRFMEAQTTTDYSWTKPNRRFVGAGTYLPSLRSEEAMGVMVLQIDESGSIGQDELREFGGHLNAILEQCRPEKLIVLHTDTCVTKVEEFTADDLPVTLRGVGGGGTDMTAGFDWVRDQGVDPACFVCLTDGYTPFGEAQPYPVLWAITTNVEAPWGEVVRVD